MCEKLSASSRAKGRVWKGEERAQELCNSWDQQPIISDWQRRGHMQALWGRSGGSRRAWRCHQHRWGCTEEPKLQLLPSVSTSEPFLWLSQMQFVTLVLCFSLQGCASPVSPWSFSLTEGNFQGHGSSLLCPETKSASTNSSEGRTAMGLQRTSLLQQGRTEE